MARAVEGTVITGGSFGGGAGGSDSGDVLGSGLNGDDDRT